MSAWCDTVTALNLTLGVFCQPVEEVQPLVLPVDDPSTWDYKVEKPQVLPPAPRFPPVIIEAAPPPPPPAAPKPRRIVKAKPSGPDPYKLALEQSLAASRGAVSSQTINFTTSSASPDLGSFTAPSGPLSSSSPNTQDRYQDAGKVSGMPVDNARILAADRYIHGTIENGYHSQISGGEVIIQVSGDVFGYHGTNILIPKGSRMLCKDGGALKGGESRASFACYRIFMGGYRSEITQLKATVSDAQARLGVSDRYDPRFFEKYGTAFILTGISTAVRLATAAASSANQTSAVGSVTDKGAEELSTKLGEITASILEQTVNLSPIVTISQGKQVVIRPGQDWYISKPGAV